MSATTPSIPIRSLPWDPALLQGRNCASCACYFQSVNPEDATQFQGFCRRQPADVTQARGQEPRLDPKTHKPVLKDGIPQMNSALIVGYIYKPTQRDGICFDGWRPLGTLPGQQGAVLSPQLKAFFNTLIDALGAMFPATVRRDLKTLLDDGPPGS